MKRFAALLLFFLLAGWATAQNPVVSAPSGASYTPLPVNGFVRVYNPTGASAISVTPQNNPNFPGGSPYLSGGFPDNQWRTAQPGSFVDVPFSLAVVSMPGGAGPYTYSYGALTGGMLRTGSNTYPAVTIIPRTININVGTASGGGWMVGEVYLTPPPALAKITVVADGAAAGARHYRIAGGASIPITLATGSNVILNSNTPGNYTNGATVEVLQAGQVIGSGTITKDQFGNFDMTITATGIPTAGTLTITWPAVMAGAAGTYQVGEETPQSFNLTGASFVQTYAPASLVPNASLITVRVAGKTRGTGTVVYNAQNSWSVNIVLKGEEDLKPGNNEALFVLDLASYNTAPVVLVLVVNGQSYSIRNVEGDATKGVRTTESLRLSNQDGSLNGVPYQWKITGRDGSNIFDNVTIAAGITPSIISYDVGNGAASKSFRVDNSATINAGEPPDAPPENSYDPTAPAVHDPGATPEQIEAEARRVEAKKDNYESVNKAISDALNKSTVPTASLPGTGEGQEGGKTATAAFGKASETVGDVGTAAGLGAGKGVGTFTGTSALSVGLAGLGTITFDPDNYGAAPGIVRTVALMALLWLYYKFCMSAFRGSMAS